jgi:hypothetical protein
MSSTFSSKSGDLLIDSKLWSDFGAHIPLIRSFSKGSNINQVEYPTFPGEPIRYHYAFYLLVAGLEISGLSISTSLNLISALGFSLLMLMIYKITYLIYRHHITSALAIYLFLFNGTLSYLIYFKNNQLTFDAIKNIFSSTQFTSFGPWDNQMVSAFWNLNIYTNQRHLGFSFALSLIVLWPLLKTIFQDRLISRVEYLISAGIILILPVFHQASFFITLSTSFFLVLLNYKSLNKLLPYFLVICLAAIPGLVHLHGLNSQLALHFGFLAEAGIKNFILYWWYNLGLYLVLIPILIFTTSKKERSLLLSVFPLFIVVNLLRLSPDIINNHKLINYFMIIVVIITSGQLNKFFTHNAFSKFITILLIFFLTISGWIDLFPIINDHAYQVSDVPNNQTAQWITENTLPESTFLTTSYLYNPASLAGRKTYLDYGYFNWSLGYQETDRRNNLNDFFDSQIDQSALCHLLQKENIDYVMISPEDGDLRELNPQQSLIKREFVPEFISDDQYYIYQVSTSCQQL